MLKHIFGADFDKSYVCKDITDVIYSYISKELKFKDVSPLSWLETVYPIQDYKLSNGDVYTPPCPFVVTPSNNIIRAPLELEPPYLVDLPNQPGIGRIRRYGVYDWRNPNNPINDIPSIADRYQHYMYHGDKKNTALRNITQI